MSESGGECKIDTVAEKWELHTVKAQLAERWADGESLRDLETAFNQAVLRAAMASAGMETVDGEPSNLYRLLTDDDVTAGKRVDAESRLREHGVDPDAVTDDFVSYQTVRTHLNECRGVQTARESAFSVADARSTVHKLVSRTETVALQAIDRLCGQDKLSITAPSVTVSVRVACSECQDEYTFATLLSTGSCSCNED
jgi:hypothetical protein